MWLMTFGDLMMILMVMFVLILSFSVIDGQKLESVIDSFNQRGWITSETIVPSPDDAGGIPDIALGIKTDQTKQEVDESLNELVSVIEAFSDQHDIVIPAQFKMGGVEMVLPEMLLFESGKTDIQDLAKQFLNEIAPLLLSISNEIKIEGHTDNVPVISGQYPTNWELSAARASQVARYFIDAHQLAPERLSVIGYGEYQPISSNDTVEGRLQNRRVVITIVN